MNLLFVVFLPLMFSMIKANEACESTGECLTKRRSVEHFLNQYELVRVAGKDTTRPSLFGSRIQKDIQAWTDAHAAHSKKDRNLFMSAISSNSPLIVPSSQHYAGGDFSHYQIIDGKLYRNSERHLVCKFPKRCRGIEHYLIKLLEQDEKIGLAGSRLPNVEFIVNTADWPQLSDELVHDKGFPPILSFSKEDQTHMDILLPAWSFHVRSGPCLPAEPLCIGRWDLKREELWRAAAATSWSDKESKGFFRGSRTSAERDAIVRLSMAEPELVDAAYVENQSRESNRAARQAGFSFAEGIPLTDHCRYRYLFNYRGQASSFRYRHLFLCGSLVFNADSWQEFFYDALIPYVHYVPLSPHRTVEEIREMLSFFREHDDLAQRIAANGFNFMYRHLTEGAVQDYWRELLLAINGTQQWPIELCASCVPVAPSNP